MKTKQDTAKTAIKLATAPVFAALVCIATLVFVVNVPATSGYFNIGETIIYIAAMLFGPLVGALAGGIGAALADLLVYPVFAPGTLIIKGFEGAIVGFLNKRLFARTSRSSWRIYTTLLGVIVGVLLAITGSIYYSGNVELYLGIPPPTNPTLIINVPTELWYALGGVITLIIALIGLRTEPELGRAIFSVIAGGLEMVFGYFVYEQFVLGKTTAIVEIPVNIGQMLIGLVVALPIVKIIGRSLPELKK